MIEFIAEFESEFSRVCLSIRIVFRSAWYLDNGASCHMMEAQELFSRLIKLDSSIQVELSDDAKYA